MAKVWEDESKQFQRGLVDRTREKRNFSTRRPGSPKPFLAFQRGPRRSLLRYRSVRVGLKS